MNSEIQELFIENFLCGSLLTFFISYNNHVKLRPKVVGLLDQCLVLEQLSKESAQFNSVQFSSIQIALGPLWSVHSTCMGSRNHSLCAGH